MNSSVAGAVIWVGGMRAAVGYFKVAVSFKVTISTNLYHGYGVSDEFLYCRAISVQMVEL
jgi:hypothetical protein